MGSSKSRPIQRGDTEITLAPRNDIRLIPEMQRCTVTQRVLAVGPASAEFEFLMSTLSPDEHHNGKLISRLSKGVLDLRVETNHYTAQEITSKLKNGEIDLPDYEGLLLVFPTTQLPDLAELNLYTELASSLGKGKGKLQICVCYIMPEGGKGAPEGGEVDILKATFTQVGVTEIKDGDTSYDDILKVMFEEVLNATYSKRPPPRRAIPSTGSDGMDVMD